MRHRHDIYSEDVEALRRFDACTLSNAIELLNLRPRNEGYLRDPVVSCMFPRIPPVAGFAAVGRMRSSAQPVHGHCYYDHEEWWRYVASVPAPRIVVMLDADDPPGAGALFGELHARICTALNCVAYISNGAVRDLPAIERLGFQLFAGSTSVSHAYAHVVDFGEEIEIGGLKIQTGDLLHGDVHGILSVPLEAVKQLPTLATQSVDAERRFVRMCMDGNFSIERLTSEIRDYTAEREAEPPVRHREM
jgi:4-hydroxy-4-methyl-2-oxoglutarate aldolase